MTIRDIMSVMTWVAPLDEPVGHIAQILADEEIGAVIVCDEDNRPQGMITDRDITTEVVAKRRDPYSTLAGDLVDGSRVVTVSADDPIDIAIESMRHHAVRRLPVVDGENLVGVVSQADLAQHASPDAVGELVQGISSAPDNTGRL